jgi:heat shock transcription factor
MGKMSSRKRNAPGALPQVQQSTGVQDSGFSTETGNISADQYMNSWNDPTLSGDINTNFADPSVFDGINFSGNAGVAAGQSSHNRIVSLDNMDNGLEAGAGQLVRRNPNQQLAARGRGPWDAFNNDANAGQPGQWETVDDDEELEQKAILAKKDAQAKRKSIPPFVQKLSR